MKDMDLSLMNRKQLRGEDILEKKLFFYKLKLKFIIKELSFDINYVN